MLPIQKEPFRNKYGNDTHHSKFLNKHFKLRTNGYDWKSKSGVKVEFKETFRKDDRSFTIFYKDVLNSDIVVCCNHSYYFYVVPSILFDSYEFKSNSAIAQPSLNTVKKLSYKSFHSVLHLKEYLNNLII